MAFLLRVELPDVPGSLGALATAVGAAGANIEAIEIVEHGSDGTAVDDVLLELPTGVLPDKVVSACHRLEGVEVLWISRYTAGTNIQLDLEAVEAITRSPAEAMDTLVELVPTVFRSDWGLLVESGDSAPATRLATSAAPELGSEAGIWLPLQRPARLDVPEDWERWTSTLVAGVPAGSKERAVLMGRRGGPEFLDSEIARLAHLTGFALSVSAEADADGAGT
ncbi:MAG: ACT domain-containing protein [Propionibacteriales bacterium]|nr:ACT domain-containing protein [Propionibacteriales bacterium]